MKLVHEQCYGTYISILHVNIVDILFFIVTLHCLI